MSHLPLLSGYDEPETLPYQITPFGTISADPGQVDAGALNEAVTPLGETKSERLDRRFGGLVDGFLQKNGLIVARASRTKLLEHVAKAMDEAALVNKAKAAGDYSDSGETKKYPPLINRITTINSPEPRWKFTDIIDRKEAEGAKGKDAVQLRTGTFTKFRRAVDEFTSYRGSDDVGTITSREIGDWQETLKQAGKLGNNTIGQRVQSLGTVIGWGRIMSYGELFPDGNPADIVAKPKFQKVPSEELAFTLEEAEVVLRAARLETKPDRRWLPWLSAYSGARINELAQLTPDAFFQVKGEWFFRLTTMGRKKIKNEHSERRVPVHPDLVREGLIEFVMGLKLGGKDRIFPSRSQGNVASWVRSELAITRKELAPSHGWRHLFEDKAIGMTSAAKDYITGRSKGRSSEGYGKTQAMLPALAREMAKLTSYLPDEVVIGGRVE